MCARRLADELVACASAARPPRCTNTGAHDVLNSISLPIVAVSASGSTSQPSRQPVIKKHLREAVGDDQPIVGRGDVEEARRAAGCGLEVQALVDLVGEDPRAGPRGSARGSPAARRASASSRWGCSAR